MTNRCQLFLEKPEYDDANSDLFNYRYSEPQCLGIRMLGDTIDSDEFVVSVDIHHQNNH